MTRKQRRRENRRRHRALRRMKVTTYDDLLERDHGWQRRNPEVPHEGILLVIDHSEGRPIVSHGIDLRTDKLVILPQEHPSDRQFGAVRVPGVGWVIPAERRNPWVKFKGRDRRGRRKTVRFYAKPRRRGRVPKQLRPYLFKARRRTRRTRRR